VTHIPLFEFRKKHNQAFNAWVEYSKKYVDAHASIEFAEHRGKLLAASISSNFLEIWEWNGEYWRQPHE